MKKYLEDNLPYLFNLLVHIIPIIVKKIYYRKKAKNALYMDFWISKL